MDLKVYGKAVQVLKEFYYLVGCLITAFYSLLFLNRESLLGIQTVALKVLPTVSFNRQSFLCNHKISFVGIFCVNY